MKARQILIAVDQLANAVCGGWADETLSSRAWRQRDRKRRWHYARIILDRIFEVLIGEIDHCRLSYESEMTRVHLPPEYRTE